MTTRTRKTPAQRAQEALDVADRHVQRLKAKGDRLAAELKEVGDDLGAATERRDYLSHSPDLAARPASDDEGSHEL